MKNLLKLTLFMLLGTLLAQAANQTATKSLTINVVSQVSITTTSLPAAVVNVPYSAQMAATGGTTPYTWATSVGSGQTGLPPGLSMSSAGAFSGTVPSTACAPGPTPCPFSFTVTVTDSTGSLAKINVEMEFQQARTLDFELIPNMLLG